MVLHTPANVIFAIAIGMRKVDFRLPFELVTEALESGEAEHSAIEQGRAGSAWLSCRPFPKGEPKALIETRLERWCEAAYHCAQESSRRRVTHLRRQPFPIIRGNGIVSRI